MLYNLKKRIEKKLLEKRSQWQLNISSKIDKTFFKEKPTFQTKIKTKKINYFVCFWGDKYLDMVRNILIPSLNQTNNVKLLNKLGYDQTFYIYCPYSKENFFESNHVKLINESVDIQVTQFERNLGERFGKFTLRNNLIDFIDKSIKSNAIASVLTADMIIGDQSLSNMVKIIDNHDICLATIHPLVNYTVFYEYFSKFFNDENNILTNQFLVKKSIENLHKSWSCFLNDDNNLPLGNHILKISDKIYQARSSRINVAFSRFKKSDIKFYQRVDNFNWIDRLWPRKLILENRYRFVSDSDLYFFSELTKEDTLPIMKEKKWLQSNLSGGTTRTLNYSINDILNAYWRT